MPFSCSQAFGFSRLRVSTLMATTWKSGPPSSAWSLSRAGISSRHGTHQVAQRLTRMVLPLKSARLMGFSSGPVKAIAGGGLGVLLTPTAATSPLASGFRRSAVSLEARHSATPAGREARGPRPYQAAPAPARTRAARPMSQVLLDFAAFDMTRDVALFGSALKSRTGKRPRLAGHNPVAAKDVVVHTLPP